MNEEVLSKNCIITTGEEETQQIVGNAAAVIADPMYQPICPKTAQFISLPHEAFSGRIYRKDIPDLTDMGFLRDYFTDCLEQ